MIDVALLGIIRRWHLRDQISLREIAKRLGISRNTVRRYLRSETVEPAYAERRSASALDVYTFKLSAWLKTESTKSRKQKRSLKQMHADLCVLGFEGSYDRVAAFARQWKMDQLDRVNAASKGTTISCIVFFVFATITRPWSFVDRFGATTEDTQAEDSDEAMEEQIKNKSGFFFYCLHLLVTPIMSASDRSKLLYPLSKYLQ